MLDETKPDDLDVTEEQVEVPEVEAETPEPEAEGEIVIAIEGEEPEADEDAEIEAELGDKGKHALKAAREAAKQARAEARELKAQLAERAAATPQVDDLGPRPVIADYGFDDDKHAAALLEWGEKKRAQDARKAEEQAQAKAQADAYQAKLDRYNAERLKVGADDDAQAKVVAVLSPQQQSALMHVSRNPAVFVAALAKYPKMLAELSAEKDILLFGALAREKEGKITVTTKAPPPPEGKLKAGVASGTVMTSGALEKLRQKAEATDDYTEYFAAKAAARGAS